MTPICNDQLTRVRNPRWGKLWTIPETYRVGDKGDKNGMPYTVKAFGACIHKMWGVKAFSPEHPRSVWMLVKYRGDRKHAWDCLLIGDTNSFAEPLVWGGRHPNPVFTHYV